MIPRRFYTLAVFCGLALVSLFFFTNRSDGVVSVPVPIPNGWTDKIEHTWDQAWKPKGEEGVKQENGATKTGGPTKKPLVVHTTPVEIAKPTIAPSSTIARIKPTPFSEDVTLPETVRVAILESGGKNEETTAALINAFGTQQNTQLSLFTLRQRYGIDDIINSFNLTHPLAANKSSTDFADAISKDPPHIVVSATCEADLVALDGPLTALLRSKKTYLFCVIHQPARWTEKDLTGKLRPWLDAQLVDLITLSQHTARYLRLKAINQWAFNTTVTVRHFIPVFPVDLPTNEDEKDSAGANSQASSPADGAVQFPIAMHGDFDATRHDYTDVFTKILPLRQKASAGVKIRHKDPKASSNTPSIEIRNISLHILGERIPPRIPEDVKPILSLDHDLPFLEQYALLSRSCILLPAFASPDSDYLAHLASWSIPLSLIAGVPLTADADILSAYAYLPKEAVWHRFADESEMHVAERVVLWSSGEHEKKKKVVKETARAIMEKQGGAVGEWVQTGLKRVERAGWRIEMGETSVGDEMV